MKKSFSSLVAVLALSFAVPLSGCEGSHEEPAASNTAALVACHLDDGTVGKDATLHVCDPQDTKKTTICHIPPGNPANAHTLCIGNAAVPAHLDNHGDYLGACRAEKPCEPPATGGSSGSNSGTGGSPASATGGTTATGGVSGAGGVPVVG